MKGLLNGMWSGIVLAPGSTVSRDNVASSHSPLPWRVQQRSDLSYGPVPCKDADALPFARNRIGAFELPKCGEQRHQRSVIKALSRVGPICTRRDGEPMAECG